MSDYLLRLHDIIIGNQQSNPPRPPLIPVSKTTWWNGVKSGRFPQPVKLGAGRATFWRASDIYKLIDQLGSASANHRGAK